MRQTNITSSQSVLQLLINNIFGNNTINNTQTTGKGMDKDNNNDTTEESNNNTCILADSVVLNS